VPCADGRRRSPAGGSATWALASGALAFFPDDPVGTKTHGLGAVHLALAEVAFVAVIVGTVAGSRAARAGGPLRASASALTVLAYGALVPVILLGHAKLTVHSLGGLYEKLFLAFEMLWLAVAALTILSTRHTEPPPATAAD